MNSKRSNRLFLVLILVHFAVVILLPLLPASLTSNMIFTYILSEAIVVVPALVMLIISKEKILSFLHFKKMKIGSVLMVVLFMLLSSPTISLVNLLSQLFVRNTIAELSPAILGLPLGVTFFFIAVWAPICEEVVCRGVFYQGYRQSGARLPAMLLSAVLFAGIHMNFNQASYAFVMGIFAVLLVEAGGSIWAAVLYHALLNGRSVLALYLYQWLDPEALRPETLTSFGNNSDIMLMSVGVYVLLAAATAPLAYCVLIWIAGHEGRQDRFKSIWAERRTKKDKMITIPLLIALILCLAYMIVGVLAEL